MIKYLSGLMGALALVAKSHFWVKSRGIFDGALIFYTEVRLDFNIFSHMSRDSISHFDGPSVRRSVGWSLGSSVCRSISLIIFHQIRKKNTLLMRVAPF